MHAVADPFAALTDEERGLLRPAPRPDWVEPMKAVLTDERFSRHGWIYERKLDGIRCIAIKARQGRAAAVAQRPQPQRALPRDRRGARGRPVGDVRARRRGGRLRGLADELRAPAAARRAHAVRVFFYVFDVLHLAGHDTTALPLRARKRLLRRALRFDGPMRLRPHRNRDGEALLPPTPAAAAGRG